MEHFNIIKKLHTDVLEEKYGKIHSEILRHDEFMREVFLSDENNIARTYALTIFEFDRNNLELKTIDNEIRNNGLIGKVFRESGYEIRKNVTGVFILQSPSWLIEKFVTQSDMAKARLSEFYAKKSGYSPLIYGTVLEVYSPDFRPPEINDIDESQLHPNTKVLEQAGYSKDEIFDLLSEDNRFDFQDNRYKKAMQFMKLIPDQTRQKFIDYITSKI